MRIKKKTPKNTTFTCVIKCPFMPSAWCVCACVHVLACVCLNLTDTRSFSAAAVPEVRGQRANRLSLAVGERLLGVLPAQSAVSPL